MSFGLDAAIRALSASQLAIQTAGQNVSNAATPGYSRQRVLLASALPHTIKGGFQVGTGVEVSGIYSTVDDGLELRLRLQHSASGRAQVDLRLWNDIESLFNEPGGGLSTQLSDVFSQVGNLQSDPSDLGFRNGVVQSGKALTANLNLLADGISTIRNGTFTQVQSLAREVNQHAQVIADLNQEITRAEATGIRANDLRDMREQRIKAISEVVEVRSIERPTGSVDLSIEGRVLVASNRASSITASVDNAGKTELLIGSGAVPVVPSGGQIAGLLAHEDTGANRVLADLDRLAFNLALEFNRVQTTGIPRDGSFDSLTSFYGVQDTNGNAARGDELLSQSGLPFTVQKGELYVTVTDKATGQLERTKIDVDPQTMTLNDLQAALDQIAHLSAAIDPNGRMRISADAGFGFDFANRLDPQPDSFGSFGGASPSIGTTLSGPFDLSTALASPPATFTVNIDGTPLAVDLSPSDFRTPSAATAAELAAAINNDLGTSATAQEVGGRLVIRSNSTGSAATLSLADGTGSPLASLGMSTGTTRTGQAQAVTPQISGSYTGSTNGSLRFVPNGDGQIGVTPGLTVSVFDENGATIATLDVGSTYSPGTQLDIGEGVQVAFGAGNVSATHGDVFELDTISDSDSSDILVALGLNSFFHGTTAADLKVNQTLQSNPDFLAAGLTGASGDASNLSRLLDLQGQDLTALDSYSIEDFYATVVGEVGFEGAAAESTVEAQDSLLANLQQQRDSISGVNIDEEMIDLLRFQQAFDAASRFVTIVNDLTQTLVNLGR